MKRHAAERDGISNLPEPILHHILSFLSLEESVRTCVLSKSWRHLGSTRPNFSLDYHIGDDEKFKKVLEKSLQVYKEQKLPIDDFRVTDVHMFDNPDMVLLLEKWIPILIQDIGVNKFSLTLWDYADHTEYFDLPDVVFKSESIQELYLQTCKLSKINCIGNIDNHLKTLHLSNVYIEEENFAKIMSICPLIEDLLLSCCVGFKTIRTHNHHNLKSFYLHHDCDVVGSIEIYLPSTIRRVIISQCPNWFHHRNYFPGLTCLKLSHVPLSHEWFNSFSRNYFPCLEELQLWKCNGFDELKLSSRSIKNLSISMDESTTKATIDAPSIKKFHCDANISQSISFTTTSSEWNSHIGLVGLYQLDVSQWFLKISEFVAALSQSQISIVQLFCHSDHWNENFQHLSDISVCCSSYKMPVAIESLKLILNSRNDSFFSVLMNGLFRIMRPREIKQTVWNDSLCRTLQMGRWEDEEMSFWQQDLEEVSLEVKNGTEWHPVQGTISWSEYVKERNYCKLRFRLKWRE